MSRLTSVNIKKSYLIIFEASLRNKIRFSRDEAHLLQLLLDFSLTVKSATLIFISGRGSAISSAKEGKSGFI